MDWATCNSHRQVCTENERIPAGFINTLGKSLIKACKRRLDAFIVCQRSRDLTYILIMAKRSGRFLVCSTRRKDADLLSGALELDADNLDNENAMCTLTQCFLEPRSLWVYRSCEMQEVSVRGRPCLLWFPLYLLRPGW